jgi:hypothetical protein
MKIVKVLFPLSLVLGLAVAGQGCAAETQAPQPEENVAIEGALVQSFAASPEVARATHVTEWAIYRNAKGALTTLGVDGAGKVIIGTKAMSPEAGIVQIDVLVPERGSLKFTTKGQVLSSTPISDTTRDLIRTVNQEMSRVRSEMDNGTRPYLGTCGASGIMAGFCCMAAILEWGVNPVADECCGLGISGAIVSCGD